MACSCSDLLDDVRVKFDLILELVNTVLRMLPSGVVEVVFPMGEGPRLMQFPKRLREDPCCDMSILDFIIGVVTSEILE